MIIDYQVGSEGSSSHNDSYQESITTTIAKADLSGAEIYKVGTDNAGTQLFVSVIYNREDAKKLIVNTVNQSGLSTAQKQALAASDRMDRAFEKH